MAASWEQAESPMARLCSGRLARSNRHPVPGRTIPPEPTRRERGDERHLAAGDGMVERQRARVQRDAVAAAANGMVDP